MRHKFLALNDEQSQLVLSALACLAVVRPWYDKELVKIARMLDSDGKDGRPCLYTRMKAQHVDGRPGRY